MILPVSVIHSQGVSKVLLENLKLQDLSRFARAISKVGELMQCHLLRGEHGKVVSDILIRSSVRRWLVLLRNLFGGGEFGAMSKNLSTMTGQYCVDVCNRSEVIVRAATATDLPAMYQLSFEQGWPHRVDDWLLMMDLAEALVLEDKSGVIGCGLRITQGESASLALILVHHSCRGRGLGKRLMAALVEQSPTPSLFLNATREGAPLYRKYGFRDVGCVSQWQGICQASQLEPPSDELESLPSADCDEVRLMLHRARGIEPETLIKAMGKVQQRLVGLRGAEGLKGFACLRHFGRGWVIGPVIALTAVDAARLILGLAADLDGEFLRVDLPESSGLEPELRGLGLSQVDSVNLMWRGDAPVIAGEEQIYALFSQATG